MAVLTTAPALAQSVRPTVVTVAQGSLQGTTRDGVEIFKGIPYAAPPVGALRWQPPLPPKAWTGVRDAAAFGTSCMQDNPAPYMSGVSEDCLFLNVWRVAGVKAGRKLPVMVWIHGGGFIRGTGTAPHYEGSHIARRGVIQVSLNYRLGRFGFFGHPALTAEKPGAPLGNYGIMDQVAALRWVQANIARFGGDPKNVTIFGESAGGMAVNILMALPEARGLFAKAIAQSAAGRAEWAPLRGAGKSSAEGIGTIVAERLGVTGTGPETAAALRALPADRLVMKSNATFGGEAAELPSFPIIDGVMIKETPFAAFSAGREAKVPYITGGNSFEASLLPQTTNDPEGFLAKTGARDQIMATFGGTPKSAAQRFGGGSWMVEPARALSRLHSRNGQKAWMYYFSYVPTSTRATLPGMPHAGEISFVFNTLKDHEATVVYKRAPVPTAEDLPVAEAAIAYWTAFAKHSDPGKAGGPVWPQLHAKTDQVLEFGLDGIKVVPHFRQAEMDLEEKLAVQPRR